MTTLLTRIASDLLAARRDGRDADREGLLFLLSEARIPGKRDGSRDSTDAEVVGVVRKQIAACQETIAAVAGTAREGGAEQQKAQADIERLTGYLPPQMTEDELKAVIETFVNGQNWTDEPKSPNMMGAVMGMLRSCYAGQYDPALASQVARVMLQG